MKAIRSILFVIPTIILLAFTAQAQTRPTDTTRQWYDRPSLSLTGIGTTAGGATTTVTNQVMDVRGFQNVTLQTRFTFANTTTSNVVYTISKSVDGTDFETTGQTTWTVAGNSTTPQIATTTIATGGAGWLKLVSIQNTHASIVVTNEYFKYGRKFNAP